MNRPTALTILMLLITSAASAASDARTIRACTDAAQRVGYSADGGRTRMAAYEGCIASNQMSDVISACADQAILISPDNDGQRSATRNFIQCVSGTTLAPFSRGAKRSSGVCQITISENGASIREYSQAANDKMSQPIEYAYKGGKLRIKTYFNPEVALYGLYYESTGAIKFSGFSEGAGNSLRQRLKLGRESAVIICGKEL